MTNLQIAVKVISDYLQQELSDDYYKDDDIKSWNEMLNAFGWDSEDAKEEIRTVLWDYANEINVDCDLNDDDEIEDNDGFTSYRKLTSEIRKELKNRKVFR